MSLPPIPIPIANGTTFYNKYRWVRPIGRGSFGEVWLAQDQAVNHEFAVKILNAGVGVDQRLREAQVGHAFTHNNLVRVHQADVATDGKVVIAMDYLPDGSITTLANPGNFLPLPVAIRTIIDTLQGLEHLHSYNFFHNDIKPQNILRGSQGQAKLADYGIVGISANGGPVQPSSWYVLHAAPETVAGNGIEARTDIFQSGLTLFRLLVGLATLHAKWHSMGAAAYAAALAKGTLITRADFPPYIPSAVCRLVQTAIDPDPAKRFQSALEMRRALERLSFAGHWILGANGALVGQDLNHLYRFEHVSALGSNASFAAFKQNCKSGRETKISQFTRKNVTNTEATKLHKAFLKAVVAGGDKMNYSPQFTTSEAGGAQLQALNTLVNCGWRYVTRAEADLWRDGRRSLPFLETQLRADLARINRITLDGRSYSFSEPNIDTAVRRLANRIPEGVVRANERMTDDLMLGIALPQTIGATSREWPFKFIDWSDWRANTFQVTSEYSVSEPGGNTIRVDLALFVNGLPLGIIEVKASHVATNEGIGQQIRNQKTGEGVPSLFYSAQLLVAANAHDPQYGTVGTPRKLWGVWKEREDPHGFAADVVNRPLDDIEAKRVASDFAPHIKRHTGLMEDGRFVTPLDELLVSLCRPERFMRLARRYMLFDGPHKKVARYQQVAVIETLLKRIEERDANGRRKGGIVWHTQGSGKSLTMVMLAKAVAMANPSARIVIVTDRTDLDEQISNTFRAVGQEPKRAATGENLLTLIEHKTPVITTLIHKFRAGLNKRRVVDKSSDIFVLVDESHRSQHGDRLKPLESMNDRMKEVLPNACFIAFTGTPIAKKEKSTFAKFGDLVQPTYSMRDAVADNAVVPLLYEGREVVTDVDEGQIDRWFEVHTRGLSDEQRADLKRKMSRAREIEGIESRLKYIAFDVGQHFATNFQGTGLKGQLAAPSKRAAIQLKKLFDDFGVVTTEVVISAPEMRESEDEVDEADDDLVRSFWRKMMERYGGEEGYNKSIVEQFKGPGDPEIIIVVDKLLTGFDAPRNTVLYVARRLKEHGLLQAIARVNRVFDEEGAPEKPFGYIIDYTGVLKNLGDALASCDALQGFNDEDIARSVVSIREEATKVPGAHAALLDVFKSVSNTFDAEAYARLLADEAIRTDFYRRLSDFLRALTVALASPSLVEETKPELLKRWKDDLGRFSSLRATVSLRYAERVDWREYEKRLRQLLDRHVVARDVVNLVEPLNIFDDIAIEGRRKNKSQSDASIADTIAHQLTRSIEEKWDEDPTFFEKFSKLIRDTIADFHKGRINELAYLAKVRALREKVEQRQDDANPTPARLRDDSHAQAFWGLARRSLTAAGVDDPELAADIALEMSKKVQERRKVGWQNDRDIENLIRNDIDDFFFEELRGRRGIMLDPAILDGIVDEMLGTARTRLAL